MYFQQYASQVNFKKFFLSDLNALFFFRSKSYFVSLITFLIVWILQPIKFWKQLLFPANSDGLFEINNRNE